MNPRTDPITFAVIKHGLDAIVDEMAYTVLPNTQGTQPNINELNGFVILITIGLKISSMKCCRKKSQALPFDLDRVETNG